MFRKKPKRSDSARAATPISDKQRALDEEAQKLKAKMEKMTNFVNNAPKLADKLKREQREELLRRAATMHPTRGPQSLVDRRTTLEANVPTAEERQIRIIRRQGRLMFVFLLLTFVAAVFYLYYTVTHG